MGKSFISKIFVIQYLLYSILKFLFLQKFITIWDNNFVKTNFNNEMGFCKYMQIENEYLALYWKMISYFE
jgi:hypothetical protein